MFLWEVINKIFSNLSWDQLWQPDKKRNKVSLTLMAGWVCDSSLLSVWKLNLYKRAENNVLVAVDFLNLLLSLLSRFVIYDINLEGILTIILPKRRKTFPQIIQKCKILIACCSFVRGRVSFESGYSWI